MENVRTWIEFSAAAIEVLAVAIMVGFIAVVTVRWLIHIHQMGEAAYGRYRIAVGKSLLVGLELLVAADIIRTVALDPSLMNVAVLSALVLVRTFLGRTLTVEVEGRCPWQNGPAASGREMTGAVRPQSRKDTHIPTGG